ncbi:MAG: stage II sporulation protein M [Chloroflexales bacterium]|nr:stage II sporulation protein M [Chloroflexales bacterium]
MSLNSIATITRREVRDTLGDWRIILPIAVLSFLLPLMLVAASSFVVAFINDEDLAGRLMPFAVLLVGFVPASFSLITALESFVGERERNSLEALLSMPVSDNELYVGKLCSSLTMPLFASFVAMLVFIFLLYLFNPDFDFAAMNLLRLIQLFLLVGLMALTMVGGAVVISSHSTSIRAANLMSSFILIPMILMVQWAAFLIISAQWVVLWLLVAVLACVAILLIRIGMLTFSREAILSREHQEAVFRLPSFKLDLGRRQSQSGDLKVKASDPRWVIAQRELNEILTDWRVLLPVFILSCIIPLLLIGGAGFAIGFVGDADLIGLLIPFAALLVGFVPASFSLITALESFVGERERNSLEALLSMPVTDNELYASKLCSALIIPLASAIAAMAVFLLAIMTLYPDLYAVSMSAVRIVQLLLMIMAVTVLMVAGAVIISSHTSSIRAATLLASFVLIPTAVMLQLQALLIIAQRWDVLWLIIGGLIVIAILLIRTGLAAFNREEILSREHEQLSLSRIATTFVLFFREYRPAGIAPQDYHSLPFSPHRFYHVELPSLLRELRLPFYVALSAMGSGLLLGNYVASAYQIEILNAFARQVGYAPAPSLELGLAIFANNLRVSILSNLFSLVSFGIFAFLVPAVAFAQIGFVTSSLQTQGGSWLELGADSPLQFLLAYVAPHGMIELPAFLLSATLGIRIGAALLVPPQGFSVGQNILWSLANFAKVWLLVLLPLILLGSFIEGLLSPLVIQFLY